VDRLSAKQILVGLGFVYLFIAALALGFIAIAVHIAKLVWGA
jgi:hypothetical protein